MAADEFRQRQRAVWASGDWDTFSRLITTVGQRVIEEAAIEPAQDVLDVGTGNGNNVAIPAALRGANVTGSDITPELFDSARRHASEAGVEVEWVEADAQDLPFGDESFDRVISTFGAMFAPDHARAAGELVRVCRPGGRVLMTTWSSDGFAGELFKLSGRYMPPPPEGVQPPPLWGNDDHVKEMFEASGASAQIARDTVEFEFESVEGAVDEYARDFGPFVAARTVLEPQGRWNDFIEDFGGLVRRFNPAEDGSARIVSEYLLITVGP